MTSGMTVTQPMEYIGLYKVYWFKHILFITRHDKGSVKGKRFIAHFEYLLKTMFNLHMVESKF